MEPGGRVARLRSRRWRHATLLVTALMLSGCAGFYDRQGFLDSLPFEDAEARVDAALAALAKGDYRAAEDHAAFALRQDPDNPYALLVSGVAFQNTGRPQRARQMYEEILSLRPTAVVSGGPWGTGEPRAVTDVAAENLRVLNAAPWASGGVATAGAMTAPDPLAVPRGMAGGVDDRGGGAATASEAAGSVGAMAQRFAVLQTLRDEGLITGEEYRQRRRANLGALLPLTFPPPAAGLDRPAPKAQEIVDRLRALRDAFEARAISARQHAVERTMILDGLLPADPVARAVAAPPPTGIMEAAAAVGRLERMRERGLITSDEYNRERTAVERAVRGIVRGSPTAPSETAEKAAPSDDSAPAEARPKDAGKAPGMLVPPPAPSGNPAAVLRTGRTPLQIVPDPSATDAMPGAASGVAVHLASFKSEARALKGWKELQAAHPVLKDLEPRITVVRLPEKGTFYRLNAGPLADRAAAEALCKDLARQSKQYCQPVFLGG